MAEHRVALVMGSESDLGVAEKAFPVLDRFGIACDVRVLSAHRSPEAVTISFHGPLGTSFSSTNRQRVMSLPERPRKSRTAGETSSPAFALGGLPPKT